MISPLLDVETVRELAPAILRQGGCPDIALLNQHGGGLSRGGAAACGELLFGRDEAWLVVGSGPASG